MTYAPGEQQIVEVPIEGVMVELAVLEESPRETKERARQQVEEAWTWQWQ